MTHPAETKSPPPSEAPVHKSVPDYLKNTYHWAYLNAKWVPFLSSSPIVETILWGNANRLIQWCTMEITPGDRVLQVACVYGRYLGRIHQAVGPLGQMDVIDVAPIQLEMAKRRLHPHSNVRFLHQDARAPLETSYDRILCFFLLHEVPQGVKGDIVNNLLDQLVDGAKLIFVDYHKPHAYHPLKPLMSVVFDQLEPFAKDLWTHDIQAYAKNPDGFLWEKETCFGGLYQKILVTKRDPTKEDPQKTIK